MVRNSFEVMNSSLPIIPKLFTVMQSEKTVMFSLTIYSSNTCGAVMKDLYFFFYL